VKEATVSQMKENSDVKTMNLMDVKTILKAEVFFGDDKLATNVTAGTGSDLMSDMLRVPKTGVVLLSGLNTVQLVRTSVIAGVAAVVLVRGKRPTPDMIAQASEHGLPLLSTPFTMFSACGRLFSRGLRGVERKKEELSTVSAKAGP
jgi:predicted transcriptional regulator